MDLLRFFLSLSFSLPFNLIWIVIPLMLIIQKTYVLVCCICSQVAYRFLAGHNCWNPWLKHTIQVRIWGAESLYIPQQMEKGYMNNRTERHRSEYTTVILCDAFLSMDLNFKIESRVYYDKTGSPHYFNMLCMRKKKDHLCCLLFKQFFSW